MLIICAVLSSDSNNNRLKDMENKLKDFVHRFGGNKNKHPQHGWKNQTASSSKPKGLKSFENEFKKKRDKLREILESLKKGQHPLLPKHPMCHHMPKLPFGHRPVYPFSPRPFRPVLPRPMVQHPMMPLKPLPAGFTEVHFFGQYQSVSQGNMLLGNGKTVHVTQIKSISVEIDFRVDNKLLARMRDQFAKYHKKWILVLGGILGGFEAVLPFVKKGCKQKHLRGINRFPKIMNRLVRLHQMIARHEALLRMLHDGEVNREKLELLEKKLKMVEERFKRLEEKMEWLKDLSQKQDETIGKWTSNHQSGSRKRKS